MPSPLDGEGNTGGFIFPLVKMLFYWGKRQISKSNMLNNYHIKKPLDRLDWLVNMGGGEEKKHS
jgi:hypothetical protein